ncbi:MAG: DUF1194 domain-containing protein [Hydrococcus sp. RU_2_2]|nr:DUF1194 domain-containing protein [Hydrococcus sp. RU_2_2]
MVKNQFNLLGSVFCTVACGLSGIGFSETALAATMVDTEISFLVDVSGSVDSSEYDLQVNGYINALKSRFYEYEFRGEFYRLVWWKLPSRGSLLDANLR